MVTCMARLKETKQLYWHERRQRLTEEWVIVRWSLRSVSVFYFLFCIFWGRRIWKEWEMSGIRIHDIKSPPKKQLKIS